MIIETFGLPGVGKTHLVKELCKISSYEEVHVSFFEKIWYAFLFCVLHPFLNLRYVFIIIRYTKQMHGPSIFRILLRKFLILYPVIIAKQQKAWFIHKGKKIVIEDGLLVLLLSSVDVTVTKPLVEKYCKSDLVVVVDVNEEVRQKRFAKRGRIPRIHYGEKYHEAWSKVLLRNKDLIPQFISSKKILFSNEGKSNAKRLLNELRKFS